MRFLHRHTIACLFMAVISPSYAAALSCARPEPPLQRLNYVGANSDKFLVGYGKFSSGTSSLVEPFPSIRGEIDFTGVLFADGETIQSSSLEVKFATYCDETWGCGNSLNFDEGPNYIIVFTRNAVAKALHIGSDVCSSSLLIEVPELDVYRAARCLSDGTCDRSDLGLADLPE